MRWGEGMRFRLTHAPLMPADAGIQVLGKGLGPRFRGDEPEKVYTYPGPSIGG